MKPPSTTKGKVIIAGAGPGDPDLLTIKAMRFIQQADVLITDRLVSEVIIDRYKRKDALVLHVGKQCRRGASTPQDVINELMVEYASQDKLVVRLKGGDVSIFSNILDELQYLSLHGIEFEIIPGITAALGAAAYAGIPLTARGHSTAVRFLTFYKQELIDDKLWDELSRTDDTLVFYMSSDTTDALVAELTLRRTPKDRGIVVLEQATTPFQRVYHCNLFDYPALMGGKKFRSPTLLIIGKVASLAGHFQWQPNCEKTEDYFNPVPGITKAEARA